MAKDKDQATASNTAVATMSDAAKAKFVPKVIKKVVVPTIKQSANETVYWQFLSAIQTKPKKEKQADGTFVDKTIDVAQVLALDTGETGQIVVGDVLRKSLEENYANGSYVGKGFSITKKDVPGKRYKTYMIDEIEVPA